MTDAPAPTLVRLDLSNNAPRPFLDSVSRLWEKELGEPRAVGADASNWFLTHRNFIPALEILDGLAEIPVDRYGTGAARLFFRLEFGLRSAESGEVLPFQSHEDYLNFEGDYNRPLGRSVLEVDFSSKNHASAYLCFPFEEWGSESVSLIRQAQSILPFGISKKRWKSWTLTKTGRSYLGRKLAVSF
jgi:hypothetical protein